MFDCWKNKDVTDIDENSHYEWESLDSNRDVISHDYKLYIFNVTKEGYYNDLFIERIINGLHTEWIWQ